MLTDDEILEAVYRRGRAYRRSRFRVACASALGAVALVATALVFIPRGPAPTSVATQPDAVASPSLKVTVDPSRPVAGEIVTFTVKEQGGSILKSILLDFGDGTPSENGGTDEGYTCGSRSPDPRQRTFEHAYHSPGELVAIASAVLEDPCATEGRPSESRIEHRVRLQVGGAPATVTNGPLLPQLSVNANMSDDTATMTATRFVSAVDDDGFVSMFEFDWGDATTKSIVARDVAKCHVGANGWPGRDDTPYQESATHTYANAGTFVVTVTVTSVGCDGHSPQTAVQHSKFTARVNR